MDERCLDLVLTHFFLQAEKLNKQTAKMYRELEQRMDRDEKLSVLQRKMQIRAILKSGMV